MDHIKNTAFIISSIVVRVSIAAETCLRSRCLVIVIFGSTIPADSCFQASCQRVLFNSRIIRYFQFASAHHVDVVGVADKSNMVAIVL
jgi:hypothetical protein